MSDKNYFSRENLIKRIEDEVETIEVEIAHQKAIPGGGYALRIGNRRIGPRTTLKGINIQAEAFLEGWKAYRDWNNKQNGN